METEQEVSMVTAPWLAVAQRAICLTEKVEALQTPKSYHSLCIMFVAQQDLPGLEHEEEEANHYGQVTRPRRLTVFTPGITPL